MLKVSVSPHLHSGNHTQKIMWDVVISLIPPMAAALFLFGLKALMVILFSTLGALAAEFIGQKLQHRPQTLSDGSAVVTGILLAFCVPPGLPLWIAFIGGFFAIIVGKTVFGGLGQNIFNPALIGRAFLLASWPTYMTTWHLPRALTWFSLNDGITGATPLGIIKEGAGSPLILLSQKNITLLDLFLGKVGGSLGETSALALLIGAAYLFIKGHITWHIPFTMIGTVFVGAFIISKFSIQVALMHVLAGGLILGAFFMATDMVTSPVTKKGRIIFGICCGILILIIRLVGKSYPEGVCYSILIMNGFVPIIDRYTRPKKFGYKK